MISLLLLVPSTEVVGATKKQWKDEIIKCNKKKMVPLNQSYARVIKGEGSRRRGIIPIRIWMRVVICKCPASIVNWSRVVGLQ